MQANSYKSFINHYSNDCFKSEILADARYANGLLSSKLDTSDFILITTQILEHIPTQDGQLLNLKKIKQQYLWEEYDVIVDDILEHAKGVSNDLYNDLLMVSKNDIPERDYSRRYFETRLGMESWNHVNNSDITPKFYKSLTLLNSSMKNSLQSIQDIDSDAEVSHTLRELAEKSEFRSLVPKLKEIAKRIRPQSKLFDVEEVIDEKTASQAQNNIRTYAENNMKTIAIMEHIARAFVLSKKDRIIIDQAQISSDPIICQQSHLNSLGTQHVIQSSAPGIMLSQQPIPHHVLRPVPSKNLVDNFRINHDLNGFSGQHTKCPFVNSISGTTVELTIILYEFFNLSFKKMTERNQSKLEKAALSSYLDFFHDEFTKPLLLGFFGFLLKNGYHSLYEMKAALDDKLPSEVRQMFGIEYSDVFPSHIVNASFQEAQEYACVVRNKDIVLDQITNTKDCFYRT